MVTVVEVGVVVIVVVVVVVILNVNGYVGGGVVVKATRGGIILVVGVGSGGFG